MWIKRTEDACKFIGKLQRLDGAINFDGDCSCQVMFELKNGKTLRIGVTDDDVTNELGIWVDQYGELALKQIPVGGRKL